MKLGLLIDTCMEMKIDPYEYDLFAITETKLSPVEGGIVNQIDYDEEHKCIRLVYNEHDFIQKNKNKKVSEEAS